MLLYNVTLIIEESTEAAWLQWMQEEHIPKVLATGLFVSNRLLKVVDSPNEGVTYCAQYVVESLADYEAYQLNHAPALQEELNLRFKDRFVAFRTLMEYVD
ncbi:DUF4286 family protein [Pedobacter sp. AW31-3R]|uniref:DUF4286 family protein n=1 Tax=Pedobacter sp. AW31-3R TaxID=3445781 RepID=UPI003F9FED52